LPIVAGWHRYGALRMARLDDLEEHTQSLDEPEWPRYDSLRRRLTYANFH